MLILNTEQKHNPCEGEKFDVCGQSTGMTIDQIIQWDSDFHSKIRTDQNQISFSLWH